MPWVLQGCSKGRRDPRASRAAGRALPDNPGQSPPDWYQRPAPTFIGDHCSSCDYTRAGLTSPPSHPLEKMSPLAVSG